MRGHNDFIARRSFLKGTMAAAAAASVRGSFAGPEAKTGETKPGLSESAREVLRLYCRLPYRLGHGRTRRRTVLGKNRTRIWHT